MGYLDKFAVNKPFDPMEDRYGIPMQSPVYNPNMASYNERLKMLSQAPRGGFEGMAAQPPTQLPAQPPSPQQQKQGGGLLDAITGNLGGIGAMMLSMSGNENLQRLGMGELNRIGETRKSSETMNKTVKALRDAGREDLAQAVASGMLPATEAAKLLYSGGQMKVVGKSAIRYNPVTGETEVLYTDQGGSDEATAAFRTLKARAEEAGLKKGTPEYTQFMIDGGSKSGFAIRTTPDGGFEFVQGGASLKPLNEFQSKATGFYGRMKYLSPIIDKYEQQGTQLFDSIVKGIPIAGNYLTSPEYKQYMYAKDNWIAAQLRDESGAAIGTDEYANADKQYFPQVGDTPEVIEQKRQLRKKAEEAMKTKAGKGVEGSEDTPAPRSIKIGDVVNGYRYKGGDPKQESSWEKI